MNAYVRVLKRVSRTIELLLLSFYSIADKIISEAVIETSEGKLDPHLIVQASLTLTCTVKAGAKSLEW